MITKNRECEETKFSDMKLNRLKTKEKAKH